MKPDLAGRRQDLRGSAYSAAGGAIRSDRGALTLAQATALAEFYRREAAEGPAAWASVCLARASALMRAADEAAAWRRAAGWIRPDFADGRKAPQARRPAVLDAP